MTSTLTALLADAGRAIRTRCGGGRFTVRTFPGRPTVRVEIRLEDLAQLAGILDASDPGHPGAPQHAYECAMVQVRTDLISHVRHGRDPLLCPYLDGWSADVRRVILEAHARIRTALAATPSLDAEGERCPRCGSPDPARHPAST